MLAVRDAVSIELKPTATLRDATVHSRWLALTPFIPKSVSDPVTRGKICQERPNVPKALALTYTGLVHPVRLLDFCEGCNLSVLELSSP